MFQVAEGHKIREDAVEVNGTVYKSVLEKLVTAVNKSGKYGMLEEHSSNDTIMAMQMVYQLLPLLLP